MGHRKDVNKMREGNGKAIKLVDPRSGILEEAERTRDVQQTNYIHSILRGDVHRCGVPWIRANLERPQYGR